MTRRLRRIWQKLRQRAWLAGQFLTGYEDTPPRNRLKASFAQNGEDLIAWHALYRLGIDLPAYLDIGAHHPFHLSNTALFHLHGSRGINIEPDPRLFAEFTRHRPGDINLNLGVAEQAGELEFHRLSDPSLSTFSATEAAAAMRATGCTLEARLRIPVTTASRVLAEHAFAPDFLSIDIEGGDLAVLRTLDFTRWRPAIICVETLEFSTGRKNPAIAEWLAGQDYRAYADTHVNTLFIDARRAFQR